MCTMVKVGVQIAETQASLKELMQMEHGATLVYERKKPPGAVDDYACLCWVDIPASAARAGYVAERQEDGDYVLHTLEH